MSIALRTNPEKPSRTEGQPCEVKCFGVCRLSTARSFDYVPPELRRDCAQDDRGVGGFSESGIMGALVSGLVQVD